MNSNYTGKIRWVGKDIVTATLWQDEVEKFSSITLHISQFPSGKIESNRIFNYNFRTFNNGITSITISFIRRRKVGKVEANKILQEVRDQMGSSNTPSIY